MSALPSKTFAMVQTAKRTLERRDLPVPEIDDDTARQAMRDLAAVGIVSGETGAAALAGFEALVADPTWRSGMGDDLADATVLVIVTEGATDPIHYEAVVGRGADTVGRVFTAVR